MKKRHFIDAHKAATGPVILLFMAYFGAWDNSLAWLYLALHGTYGVLWLLKSLYFPDTQWEQPCGVGYGVYVWSGLSGYWVSPWLIASGRTQMPEPWYLWLCVAMSSLGVFLHFASDMQKYMHLKLRPGTLLMDGLWSRLRNPNYLGELLIYAGFSLLAQHWAPLLVLAASFVIEWVPNMRKKDRSLSRYPEFAEYQARSWRIIPFVW